MLVGLSCGSRIILYDGSPFHPGLETYLKFASDEGSVGTFTVNRAFPHCEFLKGDTPGIEPPFIS
jgi:hypothetical protein